MPAVSGQYGSAKIGASCIAEVDKWSLDRECTLHEYATCVTPGNGGTAVLAGRRKHGGSMEGIYDPNDPIENYLEEGDSIDLKLYTTASKYYEGTAVIEKLSIPEVDVMNGGPIKWSATFKANGLFAAH